MADSDDDMPPPLEDMSDHIEKIQEKKKAFEQALGHTQASGKNDANPDDDDSGFTRLAPKNP